ncbi:MAG: FHA domain-containing protein [Anaerolineae bacterium]|nr:FHA domain-containing protein [Anaerolineae bacterium]
MGRPSYMNTPLQRPAVMEDLVLRVSHQQGTMESHLVRQGTVAVVLRNGRVKEVIPPGRKMVVRLPFQQIEIRLVDTRVRDLSIVSQGEFLTIDQWRVNVSLWVSYRVVNPARVAVEYAEPVHALYSTVKDLLGQVINRQNFQALSQMGRQVVRQHVLSGSPQVEQMLGIVLADVRVDDLTLPERVGTAFDERQVAQMEGEAAQWRLRGKWEDLPDSVKRSHMQERLVEGSMFVNPPLPGAPGTVPGTVPGVPQMPGAAPGVLPPSGQVVEGQVTQAQPATGQIWGRLVIVSGPKQGVVFPLRQPVVAIGRAADNNIVLQDNSVSGHHACIELRGAQAFIIDQGSSNGTYVNGRRLQQAQLFGGEVILMGDTRLRFERV